MENCIMFMNWKTQLIKRSVIPKCVYRFNVIPIKTPREFLVDINKLVLKFIRIIIGLRVALMNCYVDILTPTTSVCGLIWRQDLYRGDQLK